MCASLPGTHSPLLPAWLSRRAQIPRVSRHDLIVDEDFARFAFKQLVLGLEHLHDNHVAHRWGRGGRSRTAVSTALVAATGSRLGWQAVSPVWFAA